MKKLTAFYSLIIPVFFLIFITSCKKDTISNLPLLSTVGITSIDSTTAISGGDIFSEGGDAVTARGVCWSTSPLPTIMNNKTNDGQGTGSFASSITGLVKGTRYYVRSYATNSLGTAYGQTLAFYTLGATSIVVIPTVQTLDALNITSISASLYGTIDDPNIINDVSFEYGTSTTYGSVVAASLATALPTMPAQYSPNTMNLVQADILGLVPNTTYHFRIRVNYTLGTVYGDDFVFTTPY